MTTTKRVKAVAQPLIIEDHPKMYRGFPFLTYIQFRTEQVLAVVDNVCDGQLSCYVLDYCGPEGVSEIEFIEAATEWFINSRYKYPLSIALSRMYDDSTFAAIRRTYNLEYITRIIGPLSVFPIHEMAVTRRRRRKPIPQSIKIRRVVKLS